MLQPPFPEGSFDAVVCVTVLSHVPGSAAAIPALVRILRPRGRLGVFDLDTDMTAFTHPDRVLTRRIIAAASDETAVDGWLARRLPAIFEEAGLTEVRVRWFFPLETDAQSFYARLAERSADTALQAGAITEAEHRSWLQGLHAQLHRGPIIAGRLHIFVWGTKPASTGQ